MAGRIVEGKAAGTVVDMAGRIVAGTAEEGMAGYITLRFGLS